MQRNTTPEFSQENGYYIRAIEAGLAGVLADLLGLGPTHQARKGQQCVTHNSPWWIPRPEIVTDAASPPRRDPHNHNLSCANTRIESVGARVPPKKKKTFAPKKAKRTLQLT